MQCFFFREFSSKEQLAEHMERHKGTHPYFCHLCDFRFRNRTQLNIHLPRHSDEKPFQCQVQCSTDFDRNSQPKDIELLNGAQELRTIDFSPFLLASSFKSGATNMLTVVSVCASICRQLQIFFKISSDLKNSKTKICISGQSGPL